MTSNFPQSRNCGWRLLPAVLILTLVPSFCQAEIGCDCCGCRCMWCAWSRTWHEPTALYNPLRPYYVPRPGAVCGCDGFHSADYYDAAFACQGGCAGCGETGYCSDEYGMMEGELAASASREQSASCLAMPPCSMERLGKIPNDLGLASGGGAAVSAPVAGR